nr:MAG: hypothetical protein [uncultured archaeon]
MGEKSKFIAFRCPRELYNSILKDSENMSKFIKGAIKIYKGKEFHNNLSNAFIQYSRLFHLIEQHFKNGRTTLGINEFINLIQSTIINTEAIDKIEEIFKNGH